MSQTQPIREGFHSVIPQLVFKDATKAIDFYVKAFGAKETFRMPGPGGKIFHAEIEIGDSRIFLADEMPGSPVHPPSQRSPASSSIVVYVPDADEAYKKAIAAGSRSTMEVADMFWGDRGGGIVDPFGYAWFVATHVRDVSEDELRRAGEDEFRKMEAMSKGKGRGAPA